MRTRAARLLSLASYLGLTGWMMLWIMLLGDVAREHVSLLLLLLVTPLLLPLQLNNKKSNNKLLAQLLPQKEKLQATLLVPLFLLNLLLLNS